MAQLIVSGRRNRSAFRRSLGMLVLWSCGILCFSSLVVARRGNDPELSSTILQMHKLYTISPPHDTALYDILEVSPNATTAQITKSYRTLSRRYHPDKAGTQSSATRRLSQVQDAYDILKDDSTRLPYHQYGLTDPNVAVAILLGPHHQQNQYSYLLDRAHHDLLQLMGYEYFENDGHPSSARHPLDAKTRRDQRVQFVAARLVERLRPLVEESVTPRFAAHYLAQECDQWKRLPLGAQVIRCVGRAYRHAGQDFLQQQRSKGKVVDYYSVPIRQRWRKTKALWTALLATGKAAVAEHLWTRQEKLRRRLKSKESKMSAATQIDYHSGLGDIEYVNSNNGNSQWSNDPEAMFSCVDDDEEDDDEEERKYVQQLRAKQTLLTSMQVEALWKVAKIDLDRIIRRACRLILTREYFFFPSHQSLYYGHEHGQPAHGWVTSQGTILDADEALERAAKALVFLGSVMVERSKADTSWKE